MIDKALRDMVKKLIPDFAIVGKVTQVDENNYTCNVMPLDNDAELFKVRLKPTIDNLKKGVIAIPSIDSFVIVGLLNNNDSSPFIIWGSNFEKYYLIGENGNTFEFKNDGTILINGDNFGGLIKLSELNNNLNTIKNYLSVLKTSIGVGLAAVGVGSSANGGTGKNAFDAAMASQVINFQNMENAKVKHGSGN